MTLNCLINTVFQCLLSLISFQIEKFESFASECHVYVNYSRSVQLLWLPPLCSLAIMNCTTRVKASVGAKIENTTSMQLNSTS